MNDDSGRKISYIMSELMDVEQNKLLVLSAIFTKKTMEFRKSAEEKISRFVDDSLSFYGASKDDRDKVMNLRDGYLKALDNVIHQFYAVYMMVQQEIVFAQTNQKIAIANFITSKRGEKKAENDGNRVLVEKSNRKIMATAKKKLNYDVVIDDCMNLMESCIERCMGILEENFNVSGDSVVVTKNSVFERIKRFFVSRFSSKKKNFEKGFLNDFERKIGEIKKISVEKVSYEKANMIIFASQFERMRNEINSYFNEELNRIA